MPKYLKYSTLFLVILTMAVFAGIGQAQDDHGHDHGEADQDAHAHAPVEELPSTAVTQWTDKMELFMEHPVLVADRPGRFIIHLTILDGFQPVREGRVTLRFTDSAGKTHEIVAEELLREGIFTPTVRLAEPGPYAFVLSYQGAGLTDAFHIEDFVVHQSVRSIPHQAEDEPAAGIGFLMEQQWKIPFATAEAEVREIKRAVWAIGEVLPSPKAYAEIVAPVDGIVQIAADGSLAIPGSMVSAGDDLASITPPAQVDGWAASRLAFEQAERNYDRAKRLLDRDAISQREFEQTRTEYLGKKAGFEVLSGEGDQPTLILKAPLSGQIIEWQVRPGKHVSAGDKLMAVVDPSVVWLKVNVYENDFRTLGRPVGAYINTNGSQGGWTIPEDDMRVLTTGGAFDPATRTIPVLIEVVNSSGRLSINESSPIELYASDGISAVAVPRTAIYEDNGLHAVFVQKSGESFERRPVVLGPHYAAWVSIIEGLVPGERAVILGGYHVKLASTTAEIGHGHAH